MKHLLLKTTEAILILLSIFFIGILIPMVITTLCVIFVDNATYTEAVSSPIFWIFSVIGWVIAGCYINEVVKS